MTGQLTGYEETSVVEVGAVLDDTPADAEEVYLRTIAYSERAIAAVAAKRAGSGGALPNPITETVTVDVPAATDALIVKINGITLLHVNAAGEVTLQAEPGNKGSLQLTSDGKAVLAGSALATIEIDSDDWMYMGAGSTVNISPGGYFQIEGLHEVPGDDQIRNRGHALFYFDGTEGAAALWCKAMDYNFNIVTGKICDLA